MEKFKILSLALTILVGIALLVTALVPLSKRSYLRFLGVAFLMLASASITSMFAPNSVVVIVFSALAILSFFISLYESIVVTRENLRQMHQREHAREEALGEVLKTIAENPPIEKK